MKTKHARSGLLSGLLSLCLAALTLSPIASVQAASPTFQLLLSFNGSTTGSGPGAGVIQGADGHLYGTASGGGSGGYGTVFTLKPDGTGFTVLKNFSGSTTGTYPFAGLIQGTDGYLYGTTGFGGSSGAGAVFKLKPDGTGFAVLKNFEYSTTGASPAELIQGTDGYLYGTNEIGGSHLAGTVFKLKTDGTGFAVLLNFDDSTTGGLPYAGLIQGIDGNLYGTANGGGSSGYGTVFTLKTDGTGFAVLQNFAYNSTSGDSPLGGLIQGTDGYLYGTNGQGGSSGAGTVFKLKPDGTGFAVLQNFNYSTTGATPARLIQGTDGNLYGTTYQRGNSGYGTLFTLKPDGTGFAVLQNFDSSTTGNSPTGLIQGTDDNLYGTTRSGGAFNAGTLFRLVFPNIKERAQAVHQALSALLPSGNKDTDKRLEDAIDSLAKSLDPTLWVDGNHLTAKDGQKVFEGEKQAVQHLLEVWNDKKTPAKVVAAAADAIDKLVIIDIDLATTAIADAMTGGGDGKKLADATKELRNAAAADQADRAAEAIDHARNAWQKAQESLKK